MIHNGQLRESPRPTPRTLRGIAMRVIDASSRAGPVGDLFRIYAFAQQEQASFHWVTIAESVVLAGPEVFDPENMAGLYEIGRKAALGAAALFVYGLVDVIAVIARTIASGEVSTVGSKQLMLYFIEVFDLFLLGTVMLIMGLSLYELFMDSDLKLPARLEIHTFEDLKTNLVTVVIAVMAVTFLGQIVSWDGQTDVLGLGAAVALVVAALNIYLWIVKRVKQ